MLRRQVGEDGDVGQERGRRLQLEARHLTDDPSVRRRGRQWRTELGVAGQLRALAGALKHRGDQLGGRGLAVGAGDTHDRPRGETPTQLELVEHLQPARRGGLEQGNVEIDARALDHRRARPGRVERGQPIPAEMHVHAAAAQPSRGDRAAPAVALSQACTRSATGAASSASAAALPALPSPSTR